MKLLYTIIFCLYFVGGYSQISHSNNNDGTYLFKEASFAIYNNETKSKIEEKSIKPESLEGHEIYYQNLFKEITAYNQLLTFCILFDNKDYMVTDELVLSLAKEYKEGEIEDAKIPMQLSPYTLTIENGIATFTVRYLYGDPNYSSPLEGILTLVMTKQK